MRIQGLITSLLLYSTAVMAQTTSSNNTLNSTGVTGIQSTTANGYKLSVGGAVKLFEYGSSGAGSPSLYLSNIDGSSGGRNYYLNSDPNGVFRIVDSNASNAVRFAITSNGNVGIGTSSPAYKLDVSGTLNASGAITMGGTYGGSWNVYGTYSEFSSNTNTDVLSLISKKSTSSIWLRVNNGGRGIQLNGSSGNLLFMGGSGESLSGIGNANGTGHLAFLYSTAGNSQTEGARLANDGNFGIGTASPTAKLHVAGTFKLADGSQGANKVLTSDANGLASWQSFSGASLWTDAGSGNIYNTTTSGKVGIGTATPSSQLDITGFFRSTGLAGVPSTGTGVEIFYHNGGQDKSFIQSYSRTSSVFKGMDIEGSFIRLNGLSGGNVGIGTSSAPSYKLDIAGNQRILGNIGLGTAPTGNGITIDAAASHISGYAMQITGNVGGFTAIRVDNSNTGPSSGAGLLMLNNSNYVGFVRMDGTNASGTATYAGQLVVQSQQSGIRYVALGATTGNPSHTFYTNYPTIEERFRVDNNGASVSNGSMVSPLYLGGTGTTSNLVLQSTSGAGTTGANIRMLVGNNGATEAMRILNNGNVLVGTTTEATNYKLAVGGNIIAEKVRVKLKTGWPDYVFHQEYPLLPLKEVEQFITTNNHLPDVPSAKEIEQNGLDLGDGQAVLLKKIEELTLYMIEINKKVERLETENEVMKKQLRKN